MKSKNIIQIHKSYSALSLYEKVSVERWQRLNPEHNYTFLVHKEADQHVYDLFPEWKDHYDSLHLGARSNIRRAAILYNIGGFYTDCDMCPITPLNTYMPEDRPVVLFSHDFRQLFMNSCFASDSGEELMKEIALEGLKRTKETPPPLLSNHSKWLGWHFNTTGVHCYDETFRKFGHTLEGAISGMHYHGHDIADGKIPADLKAVHYGTALWMPKNSNINGESMYHNQNANLNLIYNLFGVSGTA